MTWPTVVAFVATMLLGAMVPGSTTALVIRQSAVHGARSAVPVVVGVEIGLYCWVIASALGVAAVFAASETAFTALRIVGAAFLIYLGVQAWRASWHVSSDLGFDDADSSSRLAWRRAVMTGAMTQLSNPKVAVFMVAFFPQFVPADSNVLVVTLLLGLAQVLIDGSWFMLVAVFLGRAKRLFSRAAFRRGLERVTGTFLIGLGVRMALFKV